MLQSDWLKEYATKCNRIQFDKASKQSDERVMV